MSSVVCKAGRRVHTWGEMADIFDTGNRVARFSLSDRGGFQRHFIEMQLWKEEGDHEDFRFEDCSPPYSLL